MARHRVFIFVSLGFFLSGVIKNDKKVANSTQRSQLLNSWGWPLFLQSQKFTLLNEIIYHQVIHRFGNSSCLIIHQHRIFLADFGAHCVETQERFQQTCLFSWFMHALRAYWHHRPLTTQYTTKKNTVSRCRKSRVAGGQKRVERFFLARRKEAFFARYVQVCTQMRQRRILRKNRKNRRTLES